jgi:hypothetical protein
MLGYIDAVSGPLTAQQYSTTFSVLFFFSTETFSYSPEGFFQSGSLLLFFSSLIQQSLVISPQIPQKSNLPNNLKKIRI